MRRRAKSSLIIVICRNVKHRASGSCIAALSAEIVASGRVNKQERASSWAGHNLLHGRVILSTNLVQEDGRKIQGLRSLGREPSCPRGQTLGAMTRAKTHVQPTSACGTALA